MSTQKAGMGRMVRFVHPATFDIRVATITLEPYTRMEVELVDLQVFMPDSNRPVMYVVGVSHDEGRAPGTWHWPERS